MRSIIAILLMLSVMGILLTPSVEDDVAGTPGVSMATGRGAIGKSNLRNLEHSFVILATFQAEPAPIW
jgi:hypothetical protein